MLILSFLAAITAQSGIFSKDWKIPIPSDYAYKVESNYQR